VLSSTVAELLTVDMRWVSVPLDTGLANTEAVCVDKWDIEVNAWGLCAGANVIQPVQPGLSAQNVWVRASGNLRGRPA
jgi:hypothetical protein